MLGIYRKTIVKVVFLSFLVSTVLYSFIKLKEETISRVDYITFITAAKIIDTGFGENLYDIPLQHDVQQTLIRKYYKTEGTLLFMNIPPLAILYLPASALSLLWGYRLMVLVGITIFLFFLWRVYKNILVKLGDFPPFGLLSILYSPFVVCTYNTQIAPFLVFGILAGIYISMINKKYFLMGFWMGLLTVKFQYLTIMPFVFLLSGDKIKTIKGFSTSFLVIVLLSVFLVGWNSFLGYFGFLIGTDNPGFSVNPRGVYSIHSFMKIFPLMKHVEAEHFFLFDVVIYILVFFIYWLKHKRLSLNQSFANAVILAVPLSVHVFSQDLIILLLPFFLFYLEYRLNKRGYYALFMAGLLYLLPFTRSFKVSPEASLLLLGFGLLTLFLDKHRIVKKETIKQ